MSEMNEGDRKLAQELLAAWEGSSAHRSAIEQAVNSMSEDAVSMAQTARRLVTAELAAKALPDEGALVEAIAQRICAVTHHTYSWSEVFARVALSAMRPTLSACVARAETAEKERDELRAAIFGSQKYDPCLKHGNFLEMAASTERGRLGAIARAETAEAKYDEALYIDHESVLASVGVGRWLSAALDDPNVCDEMKADIRRWFASGHPSFKWGEQAARDQAVARAEAAEAEAAPMNDDLLMRIADACIGHPHAKIPWPHRLLHECRDRIEALEAELKKWRNMAQQSIQNSKQER